MLQRCVMIFDYLCHNILLLMIIMCIIKFQLNIQHYFTFYSKELYCRYAYVVGNIDANVITIAKHKCSVSSHLIINKRV